MLFFIRRWLALRIGTDRRRSSLDPETSPPGGLRRNFEAFSVIRTTRPSGRETVAPWNQFLVDHAEDIRSIDTDALERASRNVAYGPRRSPDVPPDLARAAVSEEDHGHSVSTARGSRDGGSRFLVAEVPRAGGRWHQVHFNAAVIEQFFRVKHSTGQRVYLVECRPDGSMGPEEVRPCVYSESNKNHRIEVASHAGEPYPRGGPPVVVFYELQARSFAYMLLMPNETGYAEMRALTRRLSNVGKGLPRVMAEYSDIDAAWPTCPLLRVR